MTVLTSRRALLTTTVLLSLAGCSMLIDTSGLSDQPGGETPDGAFIPDGGGFADGRSLLDASNDAPQARLGPRPGCGADGGAGLNTCGPDGGSACCERPLVAGETTFRRCADNVGEPVANPEQLSQDNCCATATVSTFALDRFEVTVGRFRRFAEAFAAGWRPEPGSGKHAHVNEGRGLALLPLGTFETGWNVGWTVVLAAEQASRSALVACPGSNWTESSSATDSHPMNCVSWYEASAFCIWDEGFLPSFAEWDYAAAGGGRGTDHAERAFPWSSPGYSLAIDCTQANYGGEAFPGTACVDAGPQGTGRTAPVGIRSPAGDGYFGQSDLAGNVAEWLFDKDGALYTPCFDCAVQSNETPLRLAHGGSFASAARQLRSKYIKTATYNEGYPPETQADKIGFRCARVP